MNFFWTWSYVLAQILLASPWLLSKGLQPAKSEKSCVLKYFAWGPWIFFLLTSFRSPVEVNWPIIAFPSFFALISLSSVRFSTIRNTAIFWTAGFVFIISHLIFPWIPNAHDRLDEFEKFKNIKNEIASHEPFYASSYQMASWLWFKTQTPVFKLKDFSRPDFFDTMPEANPTKFPVFVAAEKSADLPLWLKDDAYSIVIEKQIDDRYELLRIERGR